MKLFQKLLLAPAALGLFAPVVANANESNFRDVTSYSQDQVEVSLDTFKPLSNKNPLLAGGEGNSSDQSINNFDVDTFSSTTTASFTANYALGTVEGNSSTDNLGMNYDWEMALSTSFTGNDSLDVVLNAGVASLMTELDMTSTSSIVKLDSISYTTGLGDRTNVFFASGDGAAGSSLYNTACVYGAQADTFSDCGVSAANIDEGLGTAAGASFDFGNGFSAALAYEGQGFGGATVLTEKPNGNIFGSVGLLSGGGVDAFGAQVAYTGDSYGVSLSWANIENHSSSNVIAWGATQSVGINGYFQPDLPNFPSISAGLESNHDDAVVGTTADQTSHYFVGVQWDDFGNGTLGAAFGSKTPYAENADALSMYEVFYSYNYADGITVTPLIYSKDNSGSTADRQKKKK